MIHFHLLKWLTVLIHIANPLYLRSNGERTSVEILRGCETVTQRANNWMCSSNTFYSLLNKHKHNLFYSLLNKHKHNLFYSILNKHKHNLFYSLLNKHKHNLFYSILNKHEHNLFHSILNKHKHNLLGSWVVTAVSIKVANHKSCMCGYCPCTLRRSKVQGLHTLSFTLVTYVST